MFRLSNNFVAANNMAHSSATAATSRPRPNAYSVTVSLSCNNTSDRRVIDITAGKSIQIGRSSRSGFKGLYASPTNALFDCAVVSRDHAELSMTSPWHETRPRVTITDKGSLHGTTVNGRKIENGAPFELHTGDVIELGEKITRGDDAHEGVSLTFKRLETDHFYHPRTPSPNMNRGYQVPDSPDQEASEYDSDVDLESIYDYNNQQSSAKTTPEQPKHKSDFQEAPSRLEGADGASIVDLSQDDELGVMSPAGKMNNESIVIQETYDEDAELLVPESVPAEAVADVASIDANDLNDQDIVLPDSDNDDVESERTHNTGLCQTLAGRDGATSDVEGDGHDDDQEAEDSEEEIFEYGYNSIDDADGQSDSAASDINEYGSEPESDFDEPSEVYSSAHVQQDSPEPQDPPQLQQSSKTSTIHSVLEQPKPKAQYDPVRSSQSATTASASAPLASASMPPTSAYVYGFPGYGSTCEMPATDFSNSSRWDVQPTTTPYDGSLNMTPYFNPYGAQAPFGAPFPGPPMFDPPQQSPGLAIPVSFDHYRAQTYTTPFMQTQPLTETSPTKTSGKIAITDIVDDATDPAPMVVDEASAMIEEAKNMVAAAIENATNVDSPGNTKRKASEMEGAVVIESPQQPIKKSKQEVTDNGSVVRTPARITKSRSVMRRVATTAAQYATAAAFGGAATVAFLSSPYAQSLIDFLG